MITKGDAIQSLRPNSEFVVRGGVVEWHDTNQTKPTDAEIDAEVTRLQAEYDANQYQRDRVYPSIQDQLDMQYWDKVNGTTTWQDAIAKVKADTPKPGE
jgi:hypothetical protein